MHAVLTVVEIDTGRSAEADKLLHEFAVPTAKSQEGFVRGIWLRSGDGAVGRGVVLFDTEEHATAAATAARQGPPPGAPVSMQNIEVFELAAEA
jgi:hypothetical protein